MASPNVPTTKARGGRRVVNYVDNKGRTRAANVVGGLGSALDLFIPTMPKAQQRPTAVAKRTTTAQTGVWW